MPDCITRMRSPMVPGKPRAVPVGSLGGVDGPEDEVRQAHLVPHGQVPHDLGLLGPHPEMQLRRVAARGADIPAIAGALPRVPFPRHQQRLGPGRPMGCGLAPRA